MEGAAFGENLRLLKISQVAIIILLFYQNINVKAYLDDTDFEEKPWKLGTSLFLSTKGFL